MVCRLLCRLSLLDQRADLPCQSKSNEILSDAGSGNSARAVAGIGPRAYQGGVADTPRQFTLHAAGGGGGGKMAFAVAGDCSHCTEAMPKDFRGCRVSFRG